MEDAEHTTDRQSSTYHSGGRHVIIVVKENTKDDECRRRKVEINHQRARQAETNQPRQCLHRPVHRRIPYLHKN